MSSRAAQFQNMIKHLSQVSPEVVAQEEQLTAASPFRQQFHLEPKSGFLNDPNGLSYFNGQYHLFYQWTPLAFKDNPKIWHHGWYHLASKDLVHWQDLGPGIESDCQWDKHGTYSGSAIPVGERLFLIYTGNTWTNTQSLDDWRRLPYQVGAWMDRKNVITKLKQPLITDSFPDCTGHFRDPKIWEHQGDYYAVLGAQRQNLTGTAKLIKTQGHDLTKWEKFGEIQTHEPHFGYMWECPDYFELNGQGVLLFSPQGLSPQGEKYQNIYQTGCLIGQPLDYQSLEFEHGAFQELDAGFDFYATQTFQTPDHRRIMYGWFGISEIEYPTVKYHYSGCLTIPRELSVKHDHLYQQPARELQALRGQATMIDQSVSELTKLSLAKQAAQEFDLRVDLHDCQQLILDLRANADDSQYTRLIIDQAQQVCRLSRKRSGISFAEEYGQTRSRHFKFGKQLHLQILIDTSSVEIFLQDGAVVFSARIFPAAEQTRTFVASRGGLAKINGTVWNLKGGAACLDS